MTISVTKPSINLREKLNELDQPQGLKGTELLRADTVAEARNLIGAGRKNLIINGAMQVAQRGTSDTFGQSDKGYKTVDRFQFYEQGTPTAVFAVTQESSGGPSGFPYSTKLNCTTANTSGIPASVHMYMIHLIEGQDLAGLFWGTSDAKPATLSFWVKSNVAGTYVVAMQSHNGTDLDYYTAPYYLDGTGSWQYITLSIPPNTLAAPRNTSGYGLAFDWIIQSSGEYSGGTPLTEWTDSPSTNQREAGQTADVGAAVNNYWQITGLQLEVGSTATDFEREDYGTTLSRCQRYYEISPTSYLSTYGSNSVSNIPYKVKKRTTPTSSVLEASTSGITAGTSDSAGNYLYKSGVVACSARLIADAEL